MALDCPGVPNIVVSGCVTVSRVSPHVHQVTRRFFELRGGIISVPSFPERTTEEEDRFLSSF